MKLGLQIGPPFGLLRVVRGQPVQARQVQRAGGNGSDISTGAFFRDSKESLRFEIDPGPGTGNIHLAVLYQVDERRLAFFDLTHRLVLEVETGYSLPHEWRFGSPDYTGIHRNIEGCDCELIHSSVDASAGEIWWSEELGLVMEQISPAIVVRMSDFRRVEPHPALFTIPSGLCDADGSTDF
jgi:hypothetical protein